MRVQNTLALMKVVSFEAAAVDGALFCSSTPTGESSDMAAGEEGTHEGGEGV